MSRTYECEVCVQIDEAGCDVELMLERWGLQMIQGPYPSRGWTDDYDHVFQGTVVLAGGKDEHLAHAELRVMLADFLAPLEKLATRWRCVDFDEWDEEIEEDEATDVAEAR